MSSGSQPHTPSLSSQGQSTEAMTEILSVHRMCGKYLAAPHLGTSEAKVLTGAQFLKETAGDINAVVVPSIITYEEDREA